MSQPSPVLRTLESYIEEGAGDRSLTSLTLEIGRDRRFTSLLIFSLVAHALFFAAILRLDWVMFHRPPLRTRRSAQLVKVTDIAPPPERLTLRRRPEPLERVDVNRLQYDPNDADDQRLLSRSPRPSDQRGDRGRLASAQEVERRLREMTRLRRAGADESPTLENSAPPTPPTPAVIQSANPGRIDSMPFSDPVSGSATTPPAPEPAAPAPVGRNTHDTAVGSRRGTGSESNALGLTSLQGQYIAYVRAKIINVNEANMPRKWIEDILREKVSAVFGLIIRRDGRIGSLQLVRGSGYEVLDAKAREAIRLASPFEGYPQNAGDSLQFTVTVYYTPYR